MKLKFIKLDSVISTNDEAIDLIKKKNFLKPAIISANNQKKGRGTHGRKWISKKGNIFISIVFNLDNKKLKFYEISTLNPILVKNVLNKYSKNKISIKSPNDLLIKKKKNLRNFTGNNYLWKKEILNSWNGNKYEFRPKY